ncbi:MAG TPA: hypothetical protein VFR58_11080 [Flavisolibacter sp.]|nr:hypothetical protein [Flavisolibacter sp.]
MKAIILSITILISSGIAAEAQSGKVKPSQKKSQVSKKTVKKEVKQVPPPAIVTITSISDYNAKAAEAERASMFTIADPIINALNARADGADVDISPSGVVGMPKRAYGFANGRIRLYPAGTTSSGTITGSGLVGTGSSQGTIGSNGPSLGVNGKSPYGGSSMWGSARNLWIRPDSSLRIRGDSY